MPTIEHHSHDHPRCAYCGSMRGPWCPTGGWCEHGVQLFECSPGTGCQAPAPVVIDAETLREYVGGPDVDRDALAEQAAQQRARADIDEAHAEQAAPADRYLDALRPGDELEVEILEAERIAARFVTRRAPGQILVDIGDGEHHVIDTDDIVLPAEHRGAYIAEVFEVVAEFPGRHISEVIDVMARYRHAPAPELLAAVRERFTEGADSDRA